MNSHQHPTVMPGPQTTNDRVYVFLDESGNLDFSPGGTRYFVLTSVSMKRPFHMSSALESYKYDCIERGLEEERFHCAEDNGSVRHQVFDIIGSGLQGVEIHSLIVEKSKTGPALRSDNRFYPEMLGYLLRYVLNGSFHRQARETVVITDTIPLNRQRRAIEKAVKTTLGSMLPSGARYRIFHHDSRSHYGLQIADYCCWAIYRKWARGDDRHYATIANAVLSEFDIFRTGTTLYY